MARILQSAVIILLLLRLKVVTCFSETPVQYHIQTDKGPDRYFTYQTYNGQYRKEKRLEDGSVVGTYGWVDPTGLLRLLSYFADEEGYRIVGQTNRKSQGHSAPANRLPINPIKLPISKRRKEEPILSEPAASHVDVAKEPATSSANVADITPASAFAPTSDDATPQARPKLRPLFVPKKRKKAQSRFGSSSRRRQNFVSARQRLKQQNSQQQHEYQQPTQQLQNNIVENQNKVTRNRQRVRTVVRPLSQSRRTPGLGRVQQKKPLTDFGYNEPGGKVTIDYDLGNQYRREKIFPDGTVVGEHGYVDPFGILRRTAYTSGANGLREAKQSYWIGVRIAGQS